MNKLGCKKLLLNDEEPTTHIEPQIAADYTQTGIVGLFYRLKSCRANWTQIRWDHKPCEVQFQLNEAQ